MTKEELLVSINADDNASKVLGNVHDNLENSLGKKGFAGKIAPLAKAGFLAVGAAAVGVAAGIVAITKSVASAGDEFQKMSLRTGVSSENLSTLGYAAERSGSNLATLENGFRRLSANAADAARGTGEAKESFAALGISVVTANGQLKSSDDLLLELADKFKGLKDDTAAAALAQDIFGKSGTQLLPLLKEGKDGIQALQERARALGIEFSTTAANDSAAFEDAMLDLSTAFTGIKNTIGTQFLPVFSEAVGWFTQGVVAVGTFIESAGGISEMFQDVLTMGSGFAEGMGEHIDKVFTDPTYRSTFVSNLTGVFESGLMMFSNFLTNTGTLVLAGANLIWQPIKAAALAIWDPIKNAAVAGLNAMVDSALVPINGLIAGINKIGGAFGVTIEEIDWTPLTTTAPKSIEDRWDTLKTNMSDAWGDVSAAADTMVSDLKTDAGEVHSAVTKTWDDTVIATNPKIAAIGAKYQTVMEETKAAATTAGKASGAALAIATGEGVEENKDKLFPDSQSLGGVIESHFNKGLATGIHNLITGKGSWKSFLGSLGSTILGGITETISQGAANSITSALFGGQQGGGLLASMFGGGRQAAGGEGKGFLGGFGSSMKSFFGGTGAGGIGGLITSALPYASLVAAGLTIGKPLVEGIGKALSSASGFLADTFGPKPMPEAIVEGVTRLQNTVSGLVREESAKQRVASVSDFLSAQSAFISELWASSNDITKKEEVEAFLTRNPNAVRGQKNTWQATGGNYQAFRDRIVEDLVRGFGVSRFITGGRVPGPLGAPRLVMAEGGETFTPYGQSANFVGGHGNGQEVHLHFDNITLQALDTTGMRDLMDGEFMDIVIERLKDLAFAGHGVTVSTGIETPPLT